jgi:GTP cyclohydrolase I
LTQIIGYGRLNTLINEMAGRIGLYLASTGKRSVKIYPIPRGGVPVALALAGTLPMCIVDTPEEADIVVDDLIDSAATMRGYPVKPFFALIDKRLWEYGDEWVVWPWEQTAECGIEDHVTRLIQYIGDDPTRGGLEETPARVAKAWQFWGSGYGQNPADVLKTFEDGAEGCEEMVVVKNIPFYTHCEHHMAPFFGTVTIGYLPDRKIVGLSKLSRVAQIFARRLQVQERLTAQIAEAIDTNLAPLGVGVVIKARHLCMESRGICQQGSETITSALRGLFKDDPSVRAEFLALARD